MTSKRQNRSDSRRPTAALPADYSALLLADIKNRIRAAQIRASLSVNRELIQLYRDIGGMAQVGGRAAGCGHSGFPWNGRIFTAEHLEDARLLFGLDREGSESLTARE